ncbi:MAG TPA: amidohydrolase family protein, partial [Acidimicrobiales bacterium]
TITVDGLEFRRRMPRSATIPPDETRAPGANDPDLRIKDSDEEGIWGEVIYPSLGIWAFNIRDPKLLREGVKVLNDWAIDFQRHSDRYVCCASIPLLTVDDAVKEVHRATEQGFHIAFFPTREPFGRPAYQDTEWHPLWAAMEETGMVVGFHIGTEPHTPDQRTGVVHRGPGGAILNYVETTFGGQRCVIQMIASGALDRHPDLKVLVSEGGATWGPFIADRMDEAYRQHGFMVRPTLPRPPSEYIYSQVYASFQHDRSAVQANAAMGWRNVMWGSDYPHIEGTYGHSQKTLHELFDGVPPEVSERIRIGAFAELFPHVPPAPGSTDQADLLTAST